MQTHPQVRQAPGALDGVCGRFACDHQARRGKDAVAMGGLDGLIDLVCQPEIVGRDDETLQSAASRRSPRNWKNSTPSRSRRFIICGERTISLTMDAIFGARK